MKIETHLHTTETSACARITGEEAVLAYKELGYGAVIITDHYNDFTSGKWKAKRGYKTNEEKTDCFLRGYRAAKKAGEKCGLKVFLGVEARFYKTSINDYLVYGLNEEFFYKNPDLDEMSFDEFSAILPEKALVYQAHPFRNGMTITDPKKLFGIEAFNGAKGHNSRNSIALAWAQLHKMHVISGSDAHYSDAVGRGGIVVDGKVETMDDVLEALRNDDYSLITKNPLDKLYWN